MLLARVLEERFDVAEYLRDYGPVAVSGDNLVLRCPRCEKDEKLWVLRRPKRTDGGGVKPAGTFVCYYCRGQEDEDAPGIGRGAIELLQWMEDLAWVEAFKRVADEVGGVEGTDAFVTNVERTLGELARLEPDDGDNSTLPAPVVALPDEMIFACDRRTLPDYFAERGISRDTAIDYDLGWCRDGYFRNRMIVPVIQDGLNVGFQARFLRKKPPAGVKKTVFPKGAKLSRALYNWDRARDHRQIVLMEDPFSAIAHGRGATCTFGTHVSAAQLAMLARADADDYVLMWDRDEGRNIPHMWAVAEALALVLPVRVAQIPDERDPDEMTAGERRRLIEAARPVRRNDGFAARVQRALDQL